MTSIDRNSRLNNMSDFDSDAGTEGTDDECQEIYLLEIANTFAPLQWETSWEKATWEELIATIPQKENSTFPQIELLTNSGVAGFVAKFKYYENMYSLTEQDFKEVLPFIKEGNLNTYGCLY